MIWLAAAIGLFLFAMFVGTLLGAGARDTDTLHDGATMRADRRNRLTAVNTEIERAATEAREAGKW